MNYNTTIYNTIHEDRVINLVLRGVCSTFDVNDIQTDIENLNLDITFHNIQKYETNLKCVATYLNFFVKDVFFVITM